MVSPDDSNDSQVPEDRVEKEEMVDFLTSTGKVRASLAERIYDEGMDNWAALVNGDDEYFTGFRGVGVKTSEALKELGEKKKEELAESTTSPDLNEVLSSIPRVTEKVIENLKKNGFDTFESFRELEAEKLQELKGIGPKLSVTIIEKVNEVREKYGIQDEIEEATAMEEEKAEEEAPKEKGFFEKLIDGIKAIFVGKKEEPEEKPEEEKEKSPDEEKEPSEEKPEEEKEEEAEEKPPEEEKEPSEEKSAEEKEESPDEEKEPSEEKPEEEKEEEVEEKPPEEEKEEPSEEKPEEEKEEEAEEKPPEEEKEEPSEEEAPKKSFLQALKEIIFGKKTEEEKSPEPAEEETKEEEPAEEEKEEPPEENSEDREEEPADEKDEIGMEGPLKIKGIEVEVQEKLKSSGYLSVEELREAVPEDLTMIEGIDKETAERICNAVKE
jgi:hypothetical protein